MTQSPSPTEIPRFLWATLGAIRATSFADDPLTSARLWEGNIRRALEADTTAALDTLHAIGPLDLVDFADPYADLVDFTKNAPRHWPWTIPGLSRHTQMAILAIGTAPHH